MVPPAGEASGRLLLASPLHCSVSRREPLAHCAGCARSCRLLGFQLRWTLPPPRGWGLETKPGAAKGPWPVAYSNSSGANSNTWDHSLLLGPLSALRGGAAGQVSASADPQAANALDPFGELALAAHRPVGTTSRVRQQRRTTGHLQPSLTGEGGRLPWPAGRGSPLAPSV